MVSLRERKRRREVTHCDGINDKLCSSRNSSLGCGDKKRTLKLLFSAVDDTKTAQRNLSPRTKREKKHSLEYFLFVLALPFFRISTKTLPENLLSL
ncbi:hypothetical protein Zmor_024030 [Zophobas morio]|uniref:Uncharacterized protein n=1 Tax=Zophobas morio TaxID=2755281 RepID=A0AA38I053_9CUCU|nr:hypothetical protein Zmor_024030 [Zophobas morio]